MSTSTCLPLQLQVSACQPSHLLPLNIDHCNAFYPTMLATTSSSAGQMHQFLNSAGQVQQFPSVAAAALVDVLRMSSVGPSLLLTPTAATDSVSHCHCEQYHEPVSSSSSSSSSHRPAAHCLFSLPGCNVNALWTTTTHFLPSSAPQPAVIGCECCDSPMTGVVCLQSPPLATH